MNILDDAPGILIVAALVILAFLAWGSIKGMTDAINTDKVAIAIICMVIAVILIITILAGVFYLLERVLDE